jgi:hypothetical protein
MLAGLEHSSTTAYPAACKPSINVKKPIVIQIAFGSPRMTVTATAAPPSATIVTEAVALQHMKITS